MTVEEAYKRLQELKRRRASKEEIMQAKVDLYRAKLR
jgi:hypothetical protein